MGQEQLQKDILSAWENKSLLEDKNIQDSIRTVVDLLDKGKIRIAEKKEEEWVVNEWIKKAVILYFPIQQMETYEVGMFEFHDKIALKKNYKVLGVRVVPHAIARYGSFFYLKE